MFTLSSSVRGWFAVKGQMDGGRTGQTVKTLKVNGCKYMSIIIVICLQGKVELELEVKPSSMCSAVGLGREGPQALPAPKLV